MQPSTERSRLLDAHHVGPELLSADGGLAVGACARLRVCLSSVCLQQLTACSNEGYSPSVFRPALPSARSAA